MGYSLVSMLQSMAQNYGLYISKHATKHGADFWAINQQACYKAWRRFMGYTSVSMLQSMAQISGLYISKHATKHGADFWPSADLWDMYDSNCQRWLRDGAAEAHGEDVAGTCGHTTGDHMTTENPTSRRPDNMEQKKLKKKNRKSKTGNCKIHTDDSVGKEGAHIHSRRAGSLYLPISTSA
jgi:hypothetical protein